MIRAEGIRIHFAKEIVNEGKISVPRGRITCLSGDSGSGKTSLLYLLGLFSSNGSCDFSIEGESVSLGDEESKNAIRREKYAFLFQDGALLEGVTVEENIHMMSLLGNERIGREHMIHLLKRVGLTEETLKQYPKQLSGGEQQRVALVCALAKNPVYYFVDEPTASLDEKSAAVVLKILGEEANKGKGVLIASHDSRVKALADYEYVIENREVILVKRGRNAGEVATGAQKEKKGPSSFSFFRLLKYSFLRKKKNAVLRKVIVVFCAIAIVGYVILHGVLSEMRQLYDSLINQVSDREIFVVNNSTLVDTDYDKDGNRGITKDELERIQNMQGMKEVHPFYEFTSFCVVPGKTVADSVVTVETGGSKREVLFSYVETSAAATHFVVEPFFSELKLETHADQLREEGTTYVSHELAEALGISDSDLKRGAVTLRLSVFVPVRKFLMKERTAEREIEGEYAVPEKVELTLSVKGVLSRDFTNRFSSSGEYIFFMEENEMQKVLLETQEKYKDKTYGEIESEYKLVEWNPSACVAFAESYQDVKVLSGKIENINGSFIARSDYKKVETLNSLLGKIDRIVEIAKKIILVVVFSLMFGMFLFFAMSRKREIAILRAEGLYGSEASGLVLIDGLLYSVAIILVSTVLSAIAYVVGNKLLVEGEFAFDTTMLWKMPLLCLALVMIPSAFGAIYAWRLKPDRILRY
ncbi:MAG: ATP-binding cassette domain-containing protein [Lachnospiraceae bacterium]|nr:ATP-binding cassette domain-containing protein [Lachnospiraceae bacterium]